MKKEVYPSILKGSIKAPGSKSIAQRFVAASLLANGESEIKDYPESADCIAALNVAQTLGAIVIKTGSDIRIKGGFPNNDDSGIRVPKNQIQCGESGLASRMFTPIAALYNESIEVRGEGSLLTRPFTEFDHVLPALGASCTTTNGRLPMTVSGPLLGGSATLDGSVSSQFLTGLLLALPLAQSDSELIVKSLTSIPYVQMTMEVAAMAGVEIKTDDYERFVIKGRQQYHPLKTVVPGDWSGAAFLIVAAAIAAEEGMEITNLSSALTQADARIIEVLRSSGVEHVVYSDRVVVKQSEINAFDFDATNCPDLVPPLVALAAYGNGVTTIKGAKRLLHKESNRAKALQEEFTKANIRVVVREDEIMVYPSYVRPATLNSHNDHRIAMAAAILGLGGDKITIQGAESVNKSFPSFFDTLASLGGKVYSK
jgi:3-phosphoshikimate 1-carboxyvinyltransferase